MDKASEKALISESGMNANAIVCSFCGSVILLPNVAKYLDRQEAVDIPRIKAKQGDDSKLQFDSDKVKEFWHVSDMFAFENVGFCNTVENWKYLSCADCEMGPIGAHKIETKEFLVAFERTKQKSEEASS